MAPNKSNWVILEIFVLAVFDLLWSDVQTDNEISILALLNLSEAVETLDVLSHVYLLFLTC